MNFVKLSLIDQSGEYQIIEPVFINLDFVWKINRKDDGTTEINLMQYGNEPVSVMIVKEKPEKIFELARSTLSQ